MARWTSAGANVILCHIVKPFMSDQLPTPNFKPLSNAFNYILYNQNKLTQVQFVYTKYNLLLSKKRKKSRRKKKN